MLLGEVGASVVVEMAAAPVAVGAEPAMTRIRCLMVPWDAAGQRDSTRPVIRRQLV